MMMNKKGITPVIAVVLLLMMTVAAAGAAFFWITTIQSRIQGQIGTQATDSAAQNRQIQIIGIECALATTSATQQINATVQNVGSLDIEAGTTAVTVTDNQARVIFTNLSTTNTISKGDIKVITFITPGLPTNGTHGVKITLPGGAEQNGICIGK